MSRRAFVPSSSPPSSPRPKRRHLSYSSPSTNTPRTPRTFYRSIPSDSPTNPFARNHSHNVMLPSPTSFSKHLAFRFQFIRDSRRRTDREGVYRIVQVPLNYTFRHLHRLLFFLFDEPSPPRVATNGASAKRKRKDTKREELGHLFEAQASVVVYSLAYKAGQIKNGRTWAKLSSVRDPYRYREDETSERNSDDESDQDIKSDTGDWKWEAEEDLTLAHVWPHGPDLSKAIVYHHDSGTQIHITINTSKILRRRGVGNKPHVFGARGRVSLSRGSSRDEAPKATIPVDHWNEDEVVERFLNQFPQPTTNHDLEDLEDSLSVSSSTVPTPCFTASSPGSSTAFSDPIHTPITPAPTRPRHRLRINYAHKRLARLAKKGIEEFAKDLEDDDEVDELADDDDDQEEAPDSDDVREWGMGKKDARKIERELLWDPFGDEAEL